MKSPSVMAARKHHGECSIYTKTKPLTFEHLPPEGAFNNQKALGLPFDTALKIHSLGEGVKGVRHVPMQGGAGMYSLCKECNQDTGRWYVPEYISWAIEAHNLLVRSDMEPQLTYLYHGFPLRFVKQVLTMMCSVMGPTFAKRNPDIARLVLDRNRVGMRSEVRIYAYYNPMNRQRKHDMVAIMNSETGQHSAFSEFTAYPFGFVLTVGSPPPDERLVDISHFASFGHDEMASVPLALPSFPAVSPMPGIYFPTSLVRQMRKPTEQEDAESQAIENEG